ncbi:MAG: AI-2E family transporter [Flavobacterium sp.]|nr:AI-2E family transporter [Flavobacterium sp.]
MNETIKFPFYAKITFILVMLIAIFYFLYIAQGILIPLILGFLFAVLLRPVMLFFKKRMHFPHILAVILTVLLFVAFIVGIIAFLSIQISDFTNDWDKIQHNFKIHISHLQVYIREHFNISNREQQKYINDATNDTMKNGKEIIGNTLMSFTDTLLNLTLIPIYMFLILLYRTHFMKFLCKLFKPEHHDKLKEILSQIKVAVKSYLLGLMIELVVVSTLTAIGLMVVGVEYAILLGIITGILNLIPYIGIMVACLISIFATLTGSTEISLVIGVIVVNLVVQLIDNNILVPMIVSSKVEINAIVSIVGIIVGGAIAGIPGMFLAIPIIAILKVIFDRIEPLEPWGYLMGDDLPKTYEWHKIKLPLYNYENATDTINIKAEVQSPIFTETTTHQPKDEPEVNATSSNDKNTTHED